MKIKGKLLVSNAIILILIAILFIHTTGGFRKLENQYDSMLHGSSEAMVKLREMQYTFTGQANDERGFLLTGDASYGKELQDKAAHVAELGEQLKPLFQSEEDEQLLAHILEDHKAFTAINLKVIETYNAGRKAEAQALSFGDGRTTRKELASTFDQLLKSNQQRIEAGVEEAGSVKQRNIQILTALAVAALLVSALVGYLVYRSVGRPLQLLNRRMKEIAEGEGDLTASLAYRSKDEIGELSASFDRMMMKLRELIAGIQDRMSGVAAHAQELRASTDQSARATESISDSMQNVAAGAETQLLRSEDSLHALEELASGVQRVAGMTSDFAQTTGTTAHEAETGGRYLEQTKSQMDRIRQAVTESAGVVERLGERSEEIRSIAGIVAEIAGQTNLLALNASIEAARAGEQGRGFAVVAGEIRKLADLTDRSVQQIGGLLDEVVTETTQAVASMKTGSGEVEEGVKSIQEAALVFRRILEEIRSIDVQVQDVSATAEEMSAISEEVTASISETTHIVRQSTEHTQHVAALTEEQLASMQEVAASADSVSTHTDEVRAMLGRFKV